MQECRPIDMSDFSEEGQREWTCSGDKCAVLAGSCKKQSAKIDCTLADKTSSCGHENHNVSFLKICTQSD